jgi:hypothetical protein
VFANRQALDPFATQGMRHANVWRVATVLIEQFGADAGRVAGACVRALEEMGDGELAALWTRVGRSIVELERTAPNPEDSLN